MKLTGMSMAHEPAIKEMQENVEALRRKAMLLQPESAGEAVEYDDTALLTQAKLLEQKVRLIEDAVATDTNEVEALDQRLKLMAAHWRSLPFRVGVRENDGFVASDLNPGPITLSEYGSQYVDMLPTYSLRYLLDLYYGDPSVECSITVNGGYVIGPKNVVWVAPQAFTRGAGAQYYYVPKSQAYLEFSVSAGYVYGASIKVGEYNSSLFLYQKLASASLLVAITFNALGDAQFRVPLGAAGGYPEDTSDWDGALWNWYRAQRMYPIIHQHYGNYVVPIDRISPDMYRGEFRCEVLDTDDPTAKKFTARGGRVIIGNEYVDLTDTQLTVPNNDTWNDVWIELSYNGTSEEYEASLEVGTRTDPDNIYELLIGKAYYDSTNQVVRIDPRWENGSPNVGGGRHV